MTGDFTAENQFNYKNIQKTPGPIFDPVFSSCNFIYFMASNNSLCISPFVTIAELFEI